MARATIRPYLSPTLVLLALDWADGAARPDFLGFAISRAPGFGGEDESWLPNRLGFDGPAPRGRDLPSDTSPIQKFMWWDARIDDDDRGARFRYAVTPVVGSAAAPRLERSATASVTVTLPRSIENGIGTYFNRAVVSSQAFTKEFGRAPTGRRLERALVWLANGLNQVIPEFLADSEAVEGAIYHLVDSRWVIPALEREANAALVYNKTTRDDSNAPAVAQLQNAVRFFPRGRASIMHDKFLVRLRRGRPVAVLTGSANFTPGGLTTQANVLHTFASAPLAALYLDRKRLLEGDPTLRNIAGQAAWSDPIRVGRANVRVFFPPERRGSRVSIGAVVDAVRRARRSVLFCLFSPTDAELRRAIFEAGDAGKMMFGLINKISRVGPGDEPLDAAQVAQVEIYHRSRKQKDVFAHAIFRKGGAPTGFWWEVADLPGGGGRFPVYIHHKFVLIDAESANPTIYTGSANMSKNALYRNDENLLEIKGDRRLAATYLAEFMRLYEHYRARAEWNAFDEGRRRTLRLSGNSSWAAPAYTPGTPQFKSRVSMAARE
jgi:phosphatidylserine/phosphatidylglycerophosphate/cardiolipin synthase-like enzyme